MKLRSRNLESGPVPQTLPATEKITASNLSSFLLRLPQELKTQIYTYLLGGRYIHVEDSKTKNKQRPYLLYPCRIGLTTNPKHRRYYDMSTDEELEISDSFGRDNHRNCYSHMKLFQRRGIDATYRRPRWYLSDKKERYYRPYPPGPVHLDVHLLHTCRQIYHEANHVLYSTNTFSFQDPNLLTGFLSHLDTLPSGSKTLAVRRLHLHIPIHQLTGRDDWNPALCAVASGFPSLNSIEISIFQTPRNHIHAGYEMRVNPSDSKETPFLAGLSALKELKMLKDVTVLMPQSTYRHLGSDDEGMDSYDKRVKPDDSRFLWSIAQQQEWARNVRADILGLDSASK